MQLCQRSDRISTRLRSVAEESGTRKDRGTGSESDRLSELSDLDCDARPIHMSAVTSVKLVKAVTVNSTS